MKNAIVERACLLAVASGIAFVIAGQLVAAEVTQQGAALTAWQSGVTISPVLDEADCHSIHTYFNTSPESPDGKWVLLYRSSTADAHRGDICVVRRRQRLPNRRSAVAPDEDTRVDPAAANGSLRVLAKDVVVEDAHRVACQHWLLRGREVVFHDLRDGQWVVAAVEIATGRQRVLARGRQVCWGQARGDLVPLYGPHWNPGEHRDLELLNLRTGKIRTVVTADAVRTACTHSAFAEFFREQFGERPISIFFPILSPDQQRVFFKIATPAGGDFRSAAASNRHFIVSYDLQRQQFGFIHRRWGHPAWHPDSRRIFNTTGQGFVLVDSTTGQMEKYTGFPRFRGGHPSLSADGRLFVTDAVVESQVTSGRLWAVVVGDLELGKYTVLHRFENSQGAASWRKSHPHPCFSPDGRRIYFNVSSDTRTRLYVAEVSNPAN